MFWKKKTEEPKEKKLSPKEIMMNQIEQLVPGQALSYKLPQTFGGGLAVVELNPRYPEKGKKYAMCTEELADNNPTGKRMPIWYSDKPKELATWILDRNGVPFS